MSAAYESTRNSTTGRFGTVVKALTDHSQLNDRLRTASNEHSTKYGVDLVKATEAASAPLFEWISYIRASLLTGTADELVDGVQAAMVEVAGCIALGLVRGGLFSMRAETDMLLAWIYFRDHPVEWDHTMRTGEGKLRAEVVKYMNNFIPRFDARYKLLTSQMTREQREPYALLSAHIHSQSPFTVPVIRGIEHLVGTQSRCDECVKLQADVSEYLADILTAFFARLWQDFPPSVQARIQARLSAAQLKALVT